MEVCAWLTSHLALVSGASSGCRYSGVNSCSTLATRHSRYFMMELCHWRADLPQTVAATDGDGGS